MSKELTLYQKLANDLGQAAIPVLMERLGGAIQDGDRMKVDQIIESLSKQPAKYIEPEIQRFLESKDHLSLFAAARLIQFAPSANHLDRLWDVHCDFERTTPEENRLYFANRKASFSALKASLKGNSDWLVEKLQSLDSANHPYYELVYLLANMEELESIWDDLKDVIKSKVRDDRERCIATVIACLNDSSEKDWLIERLSSSSDAIGPTCLKALFKIDPSLALEHFDKVDPLELYFTREWFLPDLILQFPEKANSKILNLLVASKAPWRIAKIYQGNENLMSPDVLELLLNELGKLIQKQVVDGTEKTSLHIPLSLLASINKCELIEVFRAKQSSGVANEITNWAIRRGGRRGLYADHEGQYALQVLSRIGGKNISHVVNSLLESDSKYARLDAFEYACRHRDGQTLEILGQRTLDDELWENEFPLEQGQAAEALCEHKSWPQVVDYIMKWGLKALTLVFDYPLIDDRENLAELVTPKNLDSRPLDSGVVEALSFVNTKVRLPEILAILSDSENDDEELITSCILAAGRLRIEESAPILSQHLNLPSRKFHTVNSLLATETDSGIIALLNSLENSFDIRVATCLLRFESAVEISTQLIKKHLSSLSGMGKVQEIQRIVNGVHDNELCKLTLVNEVNFIKSFVSQEEGSFWVMGSKHDLLLALSYLDEVTATGLAELALKTPEWHDRELYPDLIFKLVGNECKEFLWNQLLVEKQSKVKFAIARVLFRCNSESFLRSKLTGTPTEKGLACIALQFFDGVSSETKRVLDTLRRDRELKIAESAKNCLKQIQANQNTDQLVSRFLDADDNEERWLFVDLIANFADTGNSRYRTGWQTQLNAECTPLQREYLNKRIDKRRQEALDAYKRSDAK